VQAQDPGHKEESVKVVNKKTLKKYHRSKKLLAIMHRSAYIEIGLLLDVFGAAPHGCPFPPHPDRLSWIAMTREKRLFFHDFQSKQPML